MMPSPHDIARRIRTVAVALCRDDDRVLVERGFDSVGSLHFYRAIGGEIRFGERAVDALQREWREEFDLTLVAPVLLGVIENLFAYEGLARHEIVFAFEARIAERHAYQRKELGSVDAGGRQHVAVWLGADELRSGSVRLVPPRLLSLIDPPAVGARAGAGPADR